MSIKLINQPPGGERVPISKLIPMDTPLLVQIFPIYSCNFKCKYCVFSIPPKERYFISDKTKMPFDMFKKCADDLAVFPQRIKVLRFVGMGEPLLHPKISEFVKCSADKQRFERIEILTNGSLLTKETSDKLANSGLTKLLISIQGTTSNKYKEISNANIDMSNFIDNIRYFYRHPNRTAQIHIKIIDCALESEGDKDRFFNIFGDVCDTIGIEQAGPIFPDVKYNDEIKQNQINHVNQYGINVTKPMSVCTQSLYSMQINPDGNVVPCYSVPYPEIVGNVLNNSLVDIWNGDKYNNFRLSMLDGIQFNKVCNKCNIFKHRSYDSDDIAQEIPRLKDFYAK